MNPVIFLIELVRERLKLDQAGYQKLILDLETWFEQKNGKVAEFLRSPFAILLLPILLPLVKKGIDTLLNRWVGDQDDDGDADVNDLIMKLAGNILTKRGVTPPPQFFNNEE
jgi:hypothetical protein